jgi:hypothetical protein
MGVSKNEDSVNGWEAGKGDIGGRRERRKWRERGGGKEEERRETARGSEVREEVAVCSDNTIEVVSVLVSSRRLATRKHERLFCRDTVEGRRKEKDAQGSCPLSGSNPYLRLLNALNTPGIVSMLVWGKRSKLEQSPGTEVSGIIGACASMVSIATRGQSKGEGRGMVVRRRK